MSLAEARPAAAASAPREVTPTASTAGPARAAWLALLAVLALPVPGAARAAALAPWAGATGAAPEAPWVFAGLPRQTLPVTRFTVERHDGRPVLRVETAGSYGNLLHPLANVAAGRLSWRWRVEQPLAAANLGRREGDDVALKVCALFNMPREAVPFVERQLLRVAESRSGESLPTATLCYAWDPAWPDGTVVPNAYSRRVRYITLAAPLGSWSQVSRNLAADFLRAFGEESRVVPTVRAIGVGADADNTGGASVAYIADLTLNPEPAR